MELVKLGFIGLGHVGQIAHLKNYLYNDNVVVSGICDLRKDLAQQVGSFFSISNTTSNADEIINDPSIDALVIVVDRGSVFHLCEKALRAKKHVLTEKPMALNTIDAVKLVNIANDSKVIYKIGFMRRYDAGVSTFISEIDNLFKNNTLGRLSLLRIHAFDSLSSYAGGFDSISSNTEKVAANPLDQVPKWIPESRKFDYLNTLNVYCHHLNILHAIFDDSYKINLNYVNFKNRHCRIVNLTIEKNKKSSEIILELGHIPSINHDEYIEASFEGGTYRVDFPPNMLKDGVGYTTFNEYGSQSQSIRKNYFPYSWSFRNQSKDFIEDIKYSRKRYINSGAECLRDMELHDRLWEWEIRSTKND